MSQFDKAAYDHVIQKLQSQREDLMNIRNRASISAATTGLIATFFASAIGGEKLNAGLLGSDFAGLTVEALILLALLLGSFGFSGMTMLHRYNFTFTFDAVKMLENRQTLSADEFQKLYVEDGEWYFADNEKMISLAHGNLFFAVILGWAQIFVWVMLL